MLQQQPCSGVTCTQVHTPVQQHRAQQHVHQVQLLPACLMVAPQVGGRGAQPPLGTAAGAGAQAVA